MSAQRILYFDCFSGISGDMTLGALADLGVPPEHTVRELEKLGVEGWTLRFEKGAKMGIQGTRAEVLLSGSGALPGHEGHEGHEDHNHDHDHDHDHEHEGHNHEGHEHSHADHDHDHEHGGHEGHAHNSYAEIRGLIGDSALPAGTRNRAFAIFARLADAESRVHGVPIEEVHFHEVGALDSIIDIVGAAIGLEYLAPDLVLASSVELGGGFVRCEHGLFPVPAPAVVNLLEGVPVKTGAVPFETTTPTGAAILMATAAHFGDRADFCIERSAYGIGQRDTAIPNVLRLYLGKDSPRAGSAERAAGDTAAGAGTETAGTGAFSASCAGSEGVVLECNVDDMTAEQQGYLFERFLAAGAQDFWLTPIVMKKGRPAITVSLLCSPEKEAELSRLLLSETSSFGFRRYSVGKCALERRLELVGTSLGPVHIKSAFLDGKELKYKLEYEDIRQAALRSGLPLRLVQQRLEAETAVLRARTAEKKHD